MITNKIVSLSQWIYDNTIDSTSVVELSAGFKPSDHPQFDPEYGKYMSFEVSKQIQSS